MNIVATSILLLIASLPAWSAGILDDAIEFQDGRIHVTGWASNDSCPLLEAKITEVLEDSVKDHGLTPRERIGDVVLGTSVACESLAEESGRPMWMVYIRTQWCGGAQWAHQKKHGGLACQSSGDDLVKIGHPAAAQILDLVKKQADSALEGFCSKAEIERLPAFNPKCVWRLRVSN